MRDKTVVYNIWLMVETFQDFAKYYEAFEVFSKDFKKFITERCASSFKVQVTIGSYALLYPDMACKKLLPQMHIIASGKKIHEVDTLIEEFINTNFDIKCFDKFYINKNPFSKANDKLFSCVAHRKAVMKIVPERCAKLKLK